MDILKNICFYLVFTIGVGGLLIILLDVYDRLFTAGMNFFNMKKDFVDFMIQKHKTFRKVRQ